MHSNNVNITAGSFEMKPMTAQTSINQLTNQESEIMQALQSHSQLNPSPKKDASELMDEAEA